MQRISLLAILAPLSLLVLGVPSCAPPTSMGSVSPTLQEMTSEAEIQALIHELLPGVTELMGGTSGGGGGGGTGGVLGQGVEFAYEYTYAGTFEASELDLTDFAGKLELALDKRLAEYDIEVPGKGTSVGTFMAGVSRRYQTGTGGGSLNYWVIPTRGASDTGYTIIVNGFESIH